MYLPTLAIIMTMTHSLVNALCIGGVDTISHILVSRYGSLCSGDVGCVGFYWNDRGGGGSGGKNNLIVFRVSGLNNCSKRKTQQHTQTPVVN